MLAACQGFSSGHGIPDGNFSSVQSVLEMLTANQCSALTSVALQLPKTMPLHDLSLSGERAILDPANPTMCCFNSMTLDLCSHESYSLVHYKG